MWKKVGIALGALIVIGGVVWLVSEPKPATAPVEETAAQQKKIPASETPKELPPEGGEWGVLEGDVQVEYSN